MNKKLIAAILSGLLILSTFTGCTNNANAESNNKDNSTSINDLNSSDSSDSSNTQALEGMLTSEYTDRDKDETWDNSKATLITLNDNNASISGSGASYSNNILTISSEGVYVLSGNLNDSQILISATNTEKVQLVLNGVNISYSNGSVINVEQADKVFITLAEGTTNVLTDTENYTFASGEDEPNATIFSKDDLTLNGSGTLTINANYSHAIVSKDDLKITNGTYNITSAGNAIKGKDSVSILDGTFNITSGGDGIKSTNDTDTAKGYIIIDGGSFTINSQNDAIQAQTILQIADGNFDFITGGGSDNAPAHQSNDMMGGKHFGQQAPTWQTAPTESATTPTSPIPPTDSTPPVVPDETNDSTQTVPTKPTDTTNQVTTMDEESSDSTKGLKSGSDMYILGGSYTINTCDDSVHSNGNIIINNGNFTISSGDDGIHADTTLTINNGSININKSYEGLEGSEIVINDGTIALKSSDDGLNAAGGNDSSSVGGRVGQNSFTNSENGKITINGGSIAVDASGDGIDSNGSVIVTGGTVAVYGPTDNGNGAFDYDNTAQITGGTIVLSGSSGMAQNFNESINQGSIMLNFTQTQAAGIIVAVVDSNGNTILSYSPAKEFQNIVISSPLIKEGETYTIYTGGNDTGTLTNGFYVGGTYSNGEKVIDITMDKTVVSINQDGTTFSGGEMGKPGMNGNRPNKGTRQ